MKTFLTKYLKIIIGWSAVVLLIFVSIGFANKEQSKRHYKEVAFEISNQFNNYFIDEKDLRTIISEDGGQIIEGNKLARLNLREVENRLASELFISDAQTYRDLKGNLVVNAVQRRPIARVVRNNAPDAYIGDDGLILPVSEKFTSRVLLITGAFADSLVNTESIKDRYESYLVLLQKIYNDKLLRAQISQMDIDAKGEIDMYPQVTKQVIEFGMPDDIELKFKKLEVFYKMILPKKGWNYYSRVNLTYSNQIVCE